VQSTLKFLRTRDLRRLHRMLCKALTERDGAASASFPSGPFHRDFRNSCGTTVLH